MGNFSIAANGCVPLMTTITLSSFRIQRQIYQQREQNLEDKLTVSCMTFRRGTHFIVYQRVSVGSVPMLITKPSDLSKKTVNASLGELAIVRLEVTGSISLCSFFYHYVFKRLLVGHDSLSVSIFEHL